MKAGDVILKVDATPVRDGGDLREALRKAGAGAEVTLGVQREGKPLDLKVKLGGSAEPRRRGMTQKAQDAVRAAQVRALRYGHQEIDGEHLLVALLEQQEGLVPRLISRMGVDLASVKARIEGELERRPRVSGSATEAGKVYVTQRFNRLLVAAGDEAKRLKDEYISVEHLLLAIVEAASTRVTGIATARGGIFFAPLHIKIEKIEPYQCRA